VHRRCLIAVPMPMPEASFEVNSEPHTGTRPSVRLCVGLNTEFYDKPCNIEFYSASLVLYSHGHTFLKKPTRILNFYVLI
jgi:hypothetical protein